MSRVAPPSTRRSCIVMCRAASESRNTAVGRCLGSAMRPNGIPSRNCSGVLVSTRSRSVSEVHMPVSIGVSVEPGRRRSRGCRVRRPRARRCVYMRWLRPLDAAYSAIAVRGIAAALLESTTIETRGTPVDHRGRRHIERVAHAAGIDGHAHIPVVAHHTGRVDEQLDRAAGGPVARQASRTAS